ncbi:MAG TPA: FkbM family methyltransferase [Methanosarcina sp.]|nr:FkbM family methyltransferase [Methanosarcina sp.]
MLSKNFTTSQKKQQTLTSENPVIIDWFSNPAQNHTDIIIDQNNSGMYNEFFSGRTDMTIIDCGANIGLWTLFAQDSCKKIIAVEPAPHCCYILQELTMGLDNIDIVRAAVSGSDGTIKMNIHSSPTSNSIIYKTDTDVSIDVETKTFATLIKEYDLKHVDMIKCDIEGGEMWAITPETIAAVADKVDSWFIEVHQTNRGEQAWPGNLEENRQKLIKIFNDAGYNARAVINDQIFVRKV